MIDNIGRANMDYMVRLANDPEWTRAQLDRLVKFCAEHGAMYNGKPIPVPIKPHFISTRQRKLLEVGLSRLHSALEKFTDLWLEREDLQSAWNVSQGELDLYRVDPGYRPAIQVARFDAFLHDFDLKFLEFNCDSPGGTGYADVIHRGFLELFAQDSLAEKYAPSDRQRLLHLADTLLDCYQQWREADPGRTDRPVTPFTVITDWRDVSSLPDIEITVDYLQESGFDAVFADPRDLELRGTELWFKDRRVDLIYKRVIVKELVEDPDARPLGEAYKAGTVCMVNPPRSVIVGNKKILAFLRRPEVLARMTAEERKAIMDYVPWTEVLRDDKAEFQGFWVGLKDFVIDNQDKLVLKAAQSYGGKDVFLGFETDADKWQELVDKHIEGEHWIVQQLVQIPKELFPQVEGGNVNMNLMNVNINPLAFGGKYCGSYTRISKKNVINVSIGGGMTPTMTLTPRNGEI